MNSKIDGMPSPIPRPSGSTVAATSAAGASKGGRVASTAAQDDSVRLSGDAVDIAAIARQMGGEPSIDAAKVASVRTALETGSYRIDAQEIARRLTQLERELGV